MTIKGQGFGLMKEKDLYGALTGSSKNKGLSSGAGPVATKNTSSEITSKPVTANTYSTSQNKTSIKNDPELKSVYSEARNIGKDNYTSTTTEKPKSNWDNDPFLEGFYSVAEKPERAEFHAKSDLPFPNTEFHKAPAWSSPAKETDDPLAKAGREYGKNILEDEFNSGWDYILGKEHVNNQLSPIYNSTYKEALINSNTDNAKADFLAGVGAVANFAANTYMDTDEAASVIADTQLFFKTINPLLTNSLLKGVATVGVKAAPLIGVAYNISKGGIGDAVNTYKNLSENNIRAEQSTRVFDYLKNSEYKYLIDEEKSRNKFVQTLKKEVEKLCATDQIGYLPEGDNEEFRQEAIDTLMRIIFLNENYKKYSSLRDEEINNIIKTR